MLLRENVYERLRSDILSCELAPGDDMREQELAERYAVSRQPVREALLRLEREHLVTVSRARAIGSTRSRCRMREICCAFGWHWSRPALPKQSRMRRCHIEGAGQVPPLLGSLKTSRL